MAGLYPPRSDPPGPAGRCIVRSALKRSFALLSLGLTAAACAGRQTPPPTPLFPMAPAWRAEVADYVVSPLAADSRRLYVATRDGRVTALDQASNQSGGTLQPGFPMRV